MAQFGSYKLTPVGSYLIRPGEYIRSVPIILRGSVKIMRPDQDGREALLYYLGGLDACAMSLTCCLGSGQSEIRAVVEEETEMMAIPVGKVDEYLNKACTIRHCVGFSAVASGGFLYGCVDTRVGAEACIGLA